MRPFEGVHADVGTGDGSFVYRAARLDPATFFVGIDSNGESMADRSRRAAAKPARGGVANAMFVRANVESLPEELEGLCSRLTVLFPWGSLLRAIALPDPIAIAGLRRLCREGAELTVLFALPLEREQVAFTKAGLGGFDEEQASSRLSGAYRAAGFDVAIRQVTASAIARFETSWSKRLALDPARRFLAIEGAAG